MAHVHVRQWSCAAARTWPSRWVGFALAAVLVGLPGCAVDAEMAPLTRILPAEDTVTGALPRADVGDGPARSGGHLLSVSSRPLDLASLGPAAFGDWDTPR